MIFPRVIAGMVLFQLTMLGLFILKDSYVLGAFCVPLVVLTLIFKCTIDAAYFRNSFHLPMQLLREQEKMELLSDPDYNRSHGNDNTTPGNNGTEDSGDITTSAGKQDHSHSGRWTSALDSMQSTTRQRLDKPGIQQHQQEEKTPPLQPRQRRMILDEDNYKATPNDNTDYRQPPMYLNPGVLDTGLKWYGNPYLVGELPHLWLPVKAANSRKQSSVLPPQITTTAPGQSEVSSDCTNANGNNKYMRRQQSSVTAMEVAQVIRQMEASYHDSQTLDQVLVHDGKTSQQEPPPVSERPPLSILGALSSLGSFGPFALGDSRNQCKCNSNDGLGEEEADEGSDTETSDDDNHSKSAYHRIYYHHPSLRHSSASVNRIPSSSTNRIRIGSSPLLSQSTFKNS